MKPMGRLHGHCKFDEDVSASIIADMKNGLTRACASARAGISESTLSKWMSKGANGESPYDAFAKAVKKAERDSEAQHVGVIVRASEKTWQAAAWWLERKYPESWGRETELMKQIIAEFKKRKKPGAKS
jgi:transposase